MVRTPEYYVYIMANKWATIYVGVTNDLIRRVYEHKTNAVDGFTKRYEIHTLVYFESTPSREAAIEREKQLKGWRRSRKLELINSVNPEWTDLSNSWYDEAMLEQSKP